MSNWKTRQTLIEKIRDTENHNAWDEFVKYYKSYILIILNKMNINRSNQDDIVQNILLALYKYLGSYEYNPEKAQFRRWFSVVIRTQALNFLKCSRRFKDRNENATKDLQVEDFVNKPELEDIIQDEWEKYITKAAFANIASSFSGSAIEVFQMYITGKKTKEIAEELNIKQNSVLKLVNRVKIRLSNEVIQLKKDLEF